MVEKLPRSPSQQGNAQNETSISMPDEPQCCTRKWYFSRQEIEDHSPSRKDGIDLKKESRLRKLYCSFLQELGMTIKVPQTIATVSMFLGCKIEDTPRLRKDVVTAAYEILHKRDPSSPGRIRQKEVFNKQQESLLIGERFLLATIAFDLDIQLPYKPLVAALKKLKLGTDIPQVAWNFVNDWLCTTLCLQYKPHYIAAGSVFLAAKYQKVKLPTKNGNVWWLKFDISPKLLEEVIKQMLRLLEQDKGQTPVPIRGRSDQPTAAVGKPKSFVNAPIDGRHSNVGAQLETGGIAKLTSSNSCQNSAHGDNIATSEEVLPSQTSESGNADSVIEDGDGENLPARGDSNQNSRCEIVSVENRARDFNQNPSCKSVSVEDGAGESDKNSICSTVSGHNAGDSDKNSVCSTVSGHNAENIVAEDVDIENRPEAGDSDQNSGCKFVSVHNSVGGSFKNSKHMIDAARIREALKKRRSEKATNKKVAEVKNDEMDIETWIERKLESEIELESATSAKRQRIGL